MLFQQIVTDVDIRQHANAEQPRVFGQPTTDFFGIPYIPGEREMAMTAPREDPGDAILVASGLLPRLVAQARMESPSPDWEREIVE